MSTILALPFFPKKKKKVAFLLAENKMLTSAVCNVGSFALCFSKLELILNVKSFKYKKEKESCLMKQVPLGSA